MAKEWYFISGQKKKMRRRWGRVLAKHWRRWRRRTIGPVWLRQTLFFVLALALGCAVTAAVECVRAGSTADMMAWAAKYTDSFLLTALLYGAVIALVGALAGRLWIGGAAAAVVGLLLALVDYFKFSINGAPLMLEDFGLAAHAGDVAGVAGSLMPPGIFWQEAVNAALCVALAAALHPLTRLKKWWSLRIPAALILCLCLFSGSFAAGLGDLFQVDVVTRLDPSSSRNTYGLTVSLWRELSMREKAPPEGYGEAFMEEVLDRIDALLPPAAQQPYRNQFDEEAPSDLPNVIVVLSESFFDVNRLPGVSFSRDPVLNFHALQSESVSGPFFSHYLGYGTGYLEMSMHTGLGGPDLGSATNICFMEDGIYDLLASLAEQYTQTGAYTAEMLHAYDNSLYNRTVTYPLLGYAESLYSQDIQRLGLRGSVYGGYYMRDSYLFQGVLHELSAIQETGKRAFLYAISMENHQPFRPDKFGGEYQVDVACDLLNPEELEILKVGVEGIVRADNALRELTDALRYDPAPTIVAFFGDHRPTLPMPDGETLYTHLGQSPGSDTGEWTEETIGELYSSDYLIWGNEAARTYFAGYAGLRRPSGILALGPDVLTLTRQPVSRWWGMQELLRDVELVNTGIYFADGSGTAYRNRTAARLAPEQEELLRLREYVIYDAIYGKRYITARMNQCAP